MKKNIFPVSVGRGPSLKNVILIIATTLVIHSILYLKTKRSHNQILQEINHLQESISKVSLEDSSANTNEQVNYDEVELIVEEKLNEYSKSFEEYFEEATSYFGRKTKETIENISDHLEK